jgi:hypothetical protein
MKYVTIALLVSALLAPAQTPVPTPAPPAPFTLLDGTPVRLRLMQNLSSADAENGQSVAFEVLDEITVDNAIVIRKGATALGTITEAQAKRRMGRSGKLNMTIDYVRLADDQKAALRAVKGGAGGGHQGAMVGAMVGTAIVLWPAAPLFLLMHGKDMKIPKGTEITAFVNGDVKLNRAKFHTQEGS